MRRRSLRMLTLSCVVLILGGRPAAVPAADDAGPNLSGNWKLVGLRIIDQDLAVLGIKDEGGKLRATIKDAPQFRGQLKVDSITRKGDRVTARFKMGPTTVMFTGTPAKDGTIPGVFKLGAQALPARLE